jgi:hypothetical protein
MAVWNRRYERVENLIIMARNELETLISETGKIEDKAASGSLYKAAFWIRQNKKGVEDGAGDTQGS